MRPPALTILLLATVATPAAAMLPPQYYERARDQAPNVVVFDVVSVETPDTPYGDCAVSGKIIRSERGTAFAPGAPIRIPAVPCRRQDATMPVGGVIWQDMEALVRSAHGKAWVADDGELVLYQYQLYDLH